MTDEQTKERETLMASNMRYNHEHAAELAAGKKALHLDEVAEEVMKPHAWSVFQTKGGSLIDFEAQWPAQRLAIWEQGVHTRMEQTLARKRAETKVKA